MSATPWDQDARPPGLRALVAARDWASTALGPRESWSEALQATVETCLGSRFPVIIFWGPDLVQVYNDAYAPIIGAKHPEALGQTAAECFPEIWDVIGPMLHGVLDRADATWSDDLLLMLERKGFPEECYFTFSYSPAGGAPVEGVFCAVIETTRRVIGERRLDVLRDLSGSLAGGRHLDQVMDTAREVLSRHRSDLPAGLLRLLARDGEEDWWWPAESSDDARDALARAAAEVTRTGTRLLWGRGDAGSGYRPGSAAVAAYPIDRPGSRRPWAVLAVDLNQHLAFDDAYRDFLGLVASAIGAAIAGADSYEEAEQRAVALEELNRAKTAFLNNVSHEFRTPLTLLLGPLHDAVADPRLAAEIRRGLQLAERNARRLLKLVNDLLDFARLEAGRAEASYEPTDLAGLTADIASLFRSAAESAGLELVIDCPSLPEPVYVDQQMWEQIVTNLCANALKYTGSGSVTVRIRSAGDGARLEVSDTGIGIDADDIAFIFDRFHRAKSLGARSSEGTGLGLALVRELAELHGGHVGVDSQPEVGSTFSVTVPLGTAHLPARQLAAGTARPAQPLSGSTRDALASLQALLPATAPPAAAAATARREGATGTVYVVDDNADMRSYLCDLLSPHWSVVAFADAHQALATIVTDPPDLVISDVMMPAVDGFSFLSRLRRTPATAQLPVLLLSARAGEEAIVEGLEAGADDYLIKPFVARTLLARVRSHLDLAALRRDGALQSARHAEQLAFLATAAGDILAAESLEDITTVVERSARQVTGADECRLEMGRPVAGGPVDRPQLDGELSAVPLLSANGDAIATLRLAHRSGPASHHDDRNVVSELAGIAARRIEHLRRFEREHQVADTLQRALLPRTLPTIPGSGLVARYRPASETAAVGGDWYDAFLLPGGRLMLVVGDVIGHDLDAAVAMGQLRQLLRCTALESPDPSRLCEKVNRQLLALGGGEMATAAVAFFDPGTGQIALTSAGHPPPVVVERNGAAALLAVEACPPLGAVETTEYHTAETTLATGATLVLYTDGLIERRDEPLDVSLLQFCSRCRVLGGPFLEAALDRLLDEALPAGLATDDVAVLALRRER